MTCFCFFKVSTKDVLVTFKFCLWCLFQNSVLGVVLATKHFGNPLTAVPCAVSSVCHSIFGSVLAGVWRKSHHHEITETKE